MAFLTGLRDNIPKVVAVVGEIIVGFLNALTEQVPKVADAIYNFIKAVLEQVSQKVPALAFAMSPFGMLLSSGMLDGIKKGAVAITDWFVRLTGNVIRWIGDTSRTLWGKGSDLLGGLLGGIGSRVGQVASFFGRLAGSIFSWIGDTAGTLASKGSNLIGGLLNGASSRIGQVAGFFSRIGGSVSSWVGNLAGTLASHGGALINGLLNGASQGMGAVIGFFGRIGSSIAGAVPDMSRALFNAGASIINGFMDGMKSSFETAKSWASNAANVIKSLKGPPSYDKIVLRENGMLLMQGLLNGMKSEFTNVASWLSSIDPSEHMDMRAMRDKIQNALQESLNSVSEMGDLNPVITPVLDLTEFEAEARKLNAYIENSKSVVISASTDQARAIAVAAPGRQTPAEESGAASSGVKFEQNIYAPTELSTSDIYKQTRNQITMAKEELSIR
jgi:phage-related protein